MMSRFVGAFVCAWAACALGASLATAASEPLVSTGNATAITSTSATLNGSVNPEGQATTYYFEYGTTTTYGTQTASTSAGTGTAAVNVSAPIASLMPNTRYHYRLVATNASGTTLGSDVSFTTPKPPVPVVTTGRAQPVTETSATLTGTVNPRGVATDYFFQYGTTTAYGAQTPATSAGAGSANVSVSAAIGPLTPGATYHYRLVASNANGTAHGHDISLTTGRPPAGVTLYASASTITCCRLLTLTGHVLAPRSSHVPVALQVALLPAGPWLTFPTSTFASSGGAYAFMLHPASNIYYRSVADGVASPIVRVLVRFRVGLSVSRTHPVRGRLVRFHGRVDPAAPGARVLIQWLGAHGQWHVVHRARLRGGSHGFSFYNVRVRIEHGGRYRVIVQPNATNARGVSRVVRIRLR